MNTQIETRFSGCFEIEQIRQRVTVRPEPVGDLSQKIPRIAADVLLDRLKQIFLPNQFALDFIQELVGRADLFSRSIFTNERDHNKKLYNPPDANVPLICLTGLAGVGKTETIAAMARLLPVDIEYESGHFHGKVPLVPYWYASANEKARGNQLLLDFLGPSEDGKRPTASQLLSACRRRVYLHGVSLVFLDETQHIVKGLGSALVTDILLTLTKIGPPTIFLANYSLLHKLNSRNQEDTQRLLSQPRVMHPDDPNGKDWRAYVAECIRVSDGQIRANVDEFADELYRLTFGLKRLAVNLISLAYIECRSRKRNYIALGDLSAANLTPEYCSSRVSVDELKRIVLEGSRKSPRPDLYCPLDVPAPHNSNVFQFARRERDERVTAVAIDSSLTTHERKALKQIEPESRSPQAKPKRQKPVPKASAEDSKVDFVKYLEEFKPGKPKKPG